MGTDIHAWAEVLTDDGWKVADIKICDYRNYDVFAVLANVRNGYGFGGTPTSSGFIPIALPRGIPWDACAEFKAACAEMGEDGHSHSRLYLREILEFDWTRIVTCTGIIERDIWEYWRKWAKLCGESPSSYASGISGPGIRVCSPTDPLPADCTHVRDEWDMPYHRACAIFWSEDVPKLLSLGPIDDVRLVFFFDN